MAKTNDKKYRKYSQKLALDVERWVADNGLVHHNGAKVADLLAYLGVSDNAYYKWLKECPELAEAIERGREAFRRKSANRLVSSLYDAAVGHYVTEEDENTEYVPRQRRRRDGEGEDENAEEQAPPVIRKMTRSKRKRWVKPDVAAGIFLLCNIDPENYQNRQRNDIAVRKDTETQMSLDEINEEIKRLEKLENGDT